MEEFAGLRQWPTLQGIIRCWQDWGSSGVAVLIGSLAAGSVDRLSDIDLVLVLRDGSFESAWERRKELRVTGALAAWDVIQDGSRQARAHKWFTDDFVMVECLMVTPSSGFELADPFLPVGGETTLLDEVPRRGPIVRSEMTVASHPTERAYDSLKEAIRQSSLV